MKMTKLSIIIPVYNEAPTVRLILDRIKATQLVADIQKEFVIVDDGSVDESQQLVQEFIDQNPALEIKFFQHKKNKGKGASLHTGIAHASGEYLIIQDADLEYDPEEYNLLLKPVVKGMADVVYGSRFISGRPHRVLYYWHYAGNRFLTVLSNMFTNINLTDMETCYKLFNTQMIQAIQLKEKRFGFEPEITAKISRIKNIRFYEVGVSYYGRRYHEGKKIGWKDGVKAIYCILKYGLFRLN